MMNKKFYITPASQSLSFEVEGVIASSIPVHPDEGIGGEGEFSQEKEWSDNGFWK